MLERAELSMQSGPDASVVSCVSNGSSPLALESQKSKVTVGLRALSNKTATVNLSTSPNSSGTVSARLIDLGKRLIDAARAGHTDSVRQLVVGSGAPFTSDWLGTTALHQAAQQGHREIAEILLRGGVNRDARTKIERTALHLAAQSGSLEVVELLLNHGSEVNVRDMLKMTPLHWAVERGHTCIVEKLLQAGADINARSKFMLTPLDIALNSDRYDIVDLLKLWRAKQNDNNLRPCGITVKSAICSGGIFDLSAKPSDSLEATLNSLTGYFRGGIRESQDLFESSYQFTQEQTKTAESGRYDHELEVVDEACIDLVELEWNSLKFEPEFFLSNPVDDDGSESHRNIDVDEEGDEGEIDDDDDDDDDDRPQKVDYLMKIVEELQRENKQLRQKVEQLSTTTSR